MTGQRHVGQQETNDVNTAKRKANKKETTLLCVTAIFMGNLNDKLERIGPSK